MVYNESRNKNSQGDFEMAKRKVIVIGCGSRGIRYSDIMINEFSDDFEVVAAAEPVKDRLDYMKKKHSIPDEMCFSDYKPLLALPKIADVAVIASMDRDHYEQVMAAIDKGYDLLLEKPIAPTAKECREIEKAAREKGVFIIVCHVLRFSPFFLALKDIIDSGEIGKVMNIQHIEEVGNVHQSHSFVRGNWGNTDRSSCMILQKTCHDMDILAWLIGKKCTAVQSFGSLSYFTRENAPEGSPERCIDGCPHAESCPYDAVKLYGESGTDWFKRASTKKINPTKEDLIDVMKNTQYGKCVFKCDNDVVDHQTVNLKFGDDVYVDFAMSAFTKGGRFIRIMGTKGEIVASMEGNKVEVYNFLTKTTRVHDCQSSSLNADITGGHGGGDSGIIYALRETLNGVKLKSVCDITESCENHMISFAAEKSRLSGGILINMEDFDGE